MKVNVGVIGGGSAGLCAARHLSSFPDKFVPIVFERSDCVGGTWVYSEQNGTDQYGLPVHSSMYKNLRTDIPKEIINFPDFPFPVDGPSFILHTEMRDYLEQYTSHFDLRKYIKFHHIVEKVEPLEDGHGWSITARNLKDQINHVYEVAYILVCNGHYSVPHFPDIPGLENFQGHVLHSHDYKHPEDFSGKTIVCLGAGISGQDICLEICQTAKQVYLSHNDPLIEAPLPDNVTQISGVVGASERGLTLKNWDSINPDVLMFCTGYQFSFPFLPEGFLKVDNKRVTPLYKHLIHCSNPTICFVGITFAMIPFPFFDIQIRFFLKYMLGEMTLPSEEEMRKDEEDDFQEVLKMGWPASRAHFMAIKQFSYKDELARLANLKAPPKVLKELMVAVYHSRLADLVNCKNKNYRLVDEDTFIVL